MKYKEAGKKGVMSSLYSTLPETLETQHAKEASQLQSQVSAYSQKQLNGLRHQNMSPPVRADSTSAQTVVIIQLK